MSTLHKNCLAQPGRKKVQVMMILFFYPYRCYDVFSLTFTQYFFHFNTRFHLLFVMKKNVDIELVLIPYSWIPNKEYYILPVEME